MKIARSKQYDAYYNIETGEWIDPPCGDISCLFCNMRPETADITIELDIHEIVDNKFYFIDIVKFLKENE